MQEKDRPLLCWLDLETSGLDHTTDAILEVAVSVTDWDGQLTYDPGMVSAVAKFPNTTKFDPVVKSMHTANGLFNDIADHGQALSDIDAALADHISDFGRQRHELWLAGSGVAQFDIHWLRAQMPLTSASVHHYVTLDVGHLRRALRLAGETLPLPVVSEHRAGSDVRIAQDFWRWWLNSRW